MKAGDEFAQFPSASRIQHEPEQNAASWKRPYRRTRSGPAGRRRFLWLVYSGAGTSGRFRSARDCRSASHHPAGDNRHVRRSTWARSLHCVRIEGSAKRRWDTASRSGTFETLSIPRQQHRTLIHRARREACLRLRSRSGERLHRRSRTDLLQIARDDEIFFGHAGHADEVAVRRPRRHEFLFRDIFLADDIDVFSKLT